MTIVVIMTSIFAAMCWLAMLGDDIDRMLDDMDLKP
jgi:hypothetical protein